MLALEKRTELAEKSLEQSIECRVRGERAGYKRARALGLGESDVHSHDR